MCTDGSIDGWMYLPEYVPNYMRFSPSIINTAQILEINMTIDSSSHNYDNNFFIIQRKIKILQKDDY